MLKNSSIDFWNNRVRNFGHTGWADYSIYAFDQPARLKSIRKLLSLHHIKGDNAFDFGCGTGDFSLLLSEFFNNVKGYDISAEAVKIARQKSKTGTTQFYTGIPILQMPVDDGVLDLVLCITVLDHITDDNELDQTLFYFRRKLAKHGILIALEYAPIREMDEKNNYQRFDLYENWKERFASCGFTIIREYGFSQPQTSPATSYIKYINNPALRLWQKLGRFSFARKKIGSIANRMVEASDDFFYEPSDKDILKIFLLKKTQT